LLSILEVGLESLYFLVFLDNVIRPTVLVSSAQYLHLSIGFTLNSRYLLLLAHPPDLVKVLQHSVHHSFGYISCTLGSEVMGHFESLFWNPTVSFIGVFSVRFLLGRAGRTLLF
jgi:hypothetical protein